MVLPLLWGWFSDALMCERCNELEYRGPNGGGGAFCSRKRKHRNQQEAGLRGHSHQKYKIKLPHCTLIAR